MKLRPWALLGALVVGCTTVPSARIYEDDAPAGADVRAPIDAEVPFDAGAPVDDQPTIPPPPDVVRSADVAGPIDVGPPPPLPTGGCLRLSTYAVRNSPSNPVTVTVRRYPSGGVSNSQYVTFRLGDGTYAFLQQFVGALAGTTPAVTTPLGVAPNDNYGTCLNCAAIYFNCSTQPDGTYSCANTAFARTGVMQLSLFATNLDQFFSSTLFNVIFQQVNVDPATNRSTFVRDGSCFTLDELQVIGAPVLYSEPTPDAGTPGRDVQVVTTPDSGTGSSGAPSEGEGLRQQASAESGPTDTILYHDCTAATPACGTGTGAACRLQPGAAQGTCTSDCQSDADCPSYGTCVRSAGGYLLNSTTRGYCFRPCMAGGCSVSGFSCATARRIGGDETSVCVPQQWVTGDPTAACASPSQGLVRECGLTNRVSYTCTPGTMLTFGCVAGTAAAGCGTLGTCSGDPFIRVCAGDAPCGSWGAIGHSDDECGLCPLSTVTCPPGGRVRVFAGSFDTTMPLGCFVQRR